MIRLMIFSLVCLMIPASAITVSGVSSGGFMAVQTHVAFSSEITSVGVVAGGPYLCENIPACTQMPDLINVDILVAETIALSSGLLIDDVRHLRDSKAYLYSGTGDTVVDPGVVKKLHQYYSKMGVDVSGMYGIPSEHGWPVVDYGVPCETLRSPYILKCNFSFPQFMFGGDVSRGGNIVKIPQPNGPLFSMADDAYVFIPHEISTSEVHVSFHGCEQTIGDIGLDYVNRSGLNEYGMVVVYPQALRTPLNPYGCWDWWGYTGPNFATRLGPQMNLVMGLARNINDIIKSIDFS